MCLCVCEKAIWLIRSFILEINAEEGRTERHGEGGEGNGTVWGSRCIR